MLLILSSTERQSHLLNTCVAACFKKWSRLQVSMSIRNANIQGIIATNIYNAWVALYLQGPSSNSLVHLTSSVVVPAFLHQIPAPLAPSNLPNSHTSTQEHGAAHEQCTARIPASQQAENSLWRWAPFLSWQQCDPVLFFIVIFRTKSKDINQSRMWSSSLLCPLP